MFRALANAVLFKKKDVQNRPKTFWGHLGQRLVESEKKVIVYDIRGVLHSSDTLEGATEFFVKQKAGGQIGSGGVYLHNDQAWQQVEVEAK